MRRTRTGIVGGVLLILLGLLFLANQLLPGALGWLRLEASWPLLIVAAGVALLVLGLTVGTPGLAVPAVITGGIGLMLYYQNLTGAWESWAYAWALIPGFAGIGAILAGLLGEGRLWEALENGFWLIAISAVLFALFGSLLGGLKLSGSYWPVLLIVLGLLWLARNIFGGAERG
jgi:hypothetical protein